MTSVVSGGSQSFLITPNRGYRIQDVLVDGTSIGAVTSYTFSNLQANHTIHASFTLITYPGSNMYDSLITKIIQLSQQLISILQAKINSLIGK